MNPSWHNFSPSIKATSLSTSSPPPSSCHWSLLRSARLSTPPCPQLAPPSLSCWWTGDSIGLCNNSLKMSLPCFSTPPSLLSQKNNSKLTIANHWRLQWELQKWFGLPPTRTKPGPPPLPCSYLLPTLAPPIPSGNHLQQVPSHCTPLPAPMSPFHSWPADLTPFLFPLIPTQASPPGCDTAKMPPLLNKDEGRLANEEPLGPA